MKHLQIAVIGTGYVGLVSGACFAEFGINVTCADIDEEKIRQLEKGQIPFYEPGLSEKVQANVAQGRLGFTTDVAAAIADALVVLIAVGTPANRDGTPNLDAIEAVARDIGRNLSDYKVVVTKSTVPPRTGERVRSIIEAEANAIRPFCVGRKNWLFSDTLAGTKSSANLNLLIQTAKANGLEPYAYLRHVFTELPKATSVAEIATLLPAGIDPSRLLVNPN